MGVFDELNKQIGLYMEKYSEQWKDVGELQKKLKEQIRLYESNDENYNQDEALAITMKLLVNIVSHLDPNGRFKP